MHVPSAELCGNLVQVMMAPRIQVMQQTTPTPTTKSPITLRVHDPNPPAALTSWPHITVKKKSTFQAQNTV
jgi:hypothetical protein